MDVSIIVVSYNTCELTLNCIQSIIQQTSKISFELTVVDNASTDGSPQAISEQFPDIQLIELEENIGFGPGNNIGAGKTKGDYILLLNPDTIVLDHAIDKLVAFAQKHPEHKIYGGRTLFPDYSLNRESCWGVPTLWSMFCRGIGLSALFKRSKLFDPESLGSWKRDSLREVPIVSGCFLLVDRGLWENLHGFDTRFRMYAEEFDFCMRAVRIGIRPIVNPEATIVHYGGASDRVLDDQTVRQFKGRAMLMAKHYPKWKACICVKFIDLWVFNKLLRYKFIFFKSNRNKELAVTWSKIWGRRNEWSTIER